MRTRSTALSLGGRQRKQRQSRQQQPCRLYFSSPLPSLSHTHAHTLKQTTIIGQEDALSNVTLAFNRGKAELESKLHTRLIRTTLNRPEPKRRERKRPHSCMRSFKSRLEKRFLRWRYRAKPPKQRALFSARALAAQRCLAAVIQGSARTYRHTYAQHSQSSTHPFTLISSLTLLPAERRQRPNQQQQ